MREWPTPTNLKQLRGFLGLTGYYRKFVKGYAHIAGPLNRLLKKDQAYEWTVDCQEAFDELKRAMTSPPVLALPNDQDTFVLDTDAAEGSIGAVLSQIQDGQEKVVAYATMTSSTYSEKVWRQNSALSNTTLYPESFTDH